MLFQDMYDVTPAHKQQGILNTNHGQGEAMDMVLRLLMTALIQVKLYCDVSLLFMALAAT